jgi:dCMP deaminase
MVDERPDRDEWLMRLTTIVSTRGTCTRAMVGAILARDGRIISTGYVGAPAGLDHCLDAGCQVGPDGGCTRTVHAEANAIAVASRYGTRTDGAELYCTHAPCNHCAKLIINAGVSRLVYEHPYRDRSGLALLAQAGLQVVHHYPVPQYGDLRSIQG